MFIFVSTSSVLTDSWCAADTNPNHWFRVDLGSIHLVAGVLTQGRSNYDQWIKTFELEYSLDGNIWMKARNIENSKVIT